MADLDPKALNRAVFAYDDARCEAHGGDRPMSITNRKHITPMIAAAIQSYIAALPKGEPDGWKLVPVEPTDAMLNAAGERIVREYAESDWEEAKDMAEGLNPAQIWNAMIAAAGDER